MNLNNLPLENLSRDYFRSLDEEKSFIEMQKKLLRLELETAGEKEEVIQLKLFSRFKATTPLGSNIPILVSNFIKEHRLAKFSKDFFSQLVGKFAQVDLKIEDGKVDIKDLVVNKIKNDLQLTALWLLAKHKTRSELLDRQTSLDSRNYCSLVPLIPSAYKRYHGIKYSQWPIEHLHAVIDPNLSEALKCSTPKYSVDELLELRKESLTVKSGKTAGTQRNPSTTYALYPPLGSELAALPMLARIMVLQTWCAHPVNRTEYMILDLNNWDNIPEPILDAQVLTSNNDDWST